MSLIKRTLNGQYKIIRQIGAGGMAEVYVAEDLVKNVRLAVKILKPKYVKIKNFIDLFQREAQLLKELAHPHIIRIYENGRDGPYFYITMDYVDGPSLKEYVSGRKRFSIKQASVCLENVTSALQFAHSEGFYHCDIKPSNILMRDAKSYLLADFGIARVSTEVLDGGTPAYMAPELFASNNINARTDIYSLGVTFYELLSGGKLPFRGDTAPSNYTRLKERIAWEHENRPLPSLKSLNARIPNSVVGTVNRALSKNPRERYATPIEFWRSFDEAVGIRDSSSSLTDTIIGQVSKQGLEGIKDTFGRNRKNSSGLLPSANPRLQAVAGQFAGRKYAIPKPGKALYVGRSSQNQLRLKDRSVSRFHATLWQNQKKVFIRDEQSKMGVLVNGKRISGTLALKQGDRIQIGKSDLFQILKR